MSTGNYVPLTGARTAFAERAALRDRIEQAQRTVRRRPGRP